MQGCSSSFSGWYTLLILFIMEKKCSNDICFGRGFRKVDPSVSAVGFNPVVREKEIAVEIDPVSKFCIETVGEGEIDMVINIGFVKSGMYHLVKNEIERVKSIVRERCLKVILETCYLNEEEIEKVVKIAASAGADYIKTSTGFGSRGASFSDIEIMKKASEGTNLKIKASGGIRDIETALKYLEMGVSRIGTSNGVAIINKSNNIQAGY